VIFGICSAFFRPALEKNPPDRRLCRPQFRLAVVQLPAPKPKVRNCLSFITYPESLDVFASHKHPMNPAPAAFLGKTERSDAVQSVNVCVKPNVNAPQVMCHSNFGSPMSVASQEVASSVASLSMHHVLEGTVQQLALPAHTLGSRRDLS
jgi:hypothetical protein